MILFYFLITQMPLDQDPTWGQFLGAATLIKYLGLACVFYALMYMVSRGSTPRYLATSQSRIYMLFLLIASISYWFMGPTFSIRTSPFISLLSMAFLFFVTLSTVDTLSRLRWTLLAALASMGWASLFVMREWQRDPMWRPGSIAGDANYFALDACFVLPLAFVFVWRSRVRWERLFALGCLIATIGSTILGASRGGFIALAVAFLWLVLHSARPLRNFILIAVLVTPPVLLLPSSPLRRLMHPKYSDMTGENDRLIAWKAGLRMIRQHPLMGIGLGEFKPKMLQYADPGVGFTSIAHNTYLEIAAETGIPNFLVFVAMLFCTYLTLNKVRRQAADSGPPIVYIAATGIQAGFVGYFVGAFFLSSEYLKLFWLWMFLGMVLPSFLTNRSQKRDKEPQYAVSLTETVPESIRT